MNEAALYIMSKLSSDTKSSEISDEELQIIELYLGLHTIQASNETRISEIRTEIHKQNAFLTTSINDNSIIENEIFKNSTYVRDIYNRRLQNKATGKRLTVERYRASIEDVEQALITLRDVMYYPMHLASETEDERVVRFVGGIAEFIFKKVQIEFKELAKQLDEESNDPTIAR